MKYVVDEEYFPMEFSEAERNTAISIAEVLANKGREITIRVVKSEDEPEKREICYCADCECYESHINESGRLIQMCQMYDIEVHGDFYCATGELNRKEEE